jgi:hypothetical protein
MRRQKSVVCLASFQEVLRVEWPSGWNRDGRVDPFRAFDHLSLPTLGATVMPDAPLCEPNEKRRLMDMRRSGARGRRGQCRHDRPRRENGQFDRHQQGAAKTYMPVNLAAVRAADEARRKRTALTGRRTQQARKVETRRRMKVETARGQRPKPW